VASGERVCALETEAVKAKTTKKKYFFMQNNGFLQI
jgi:hypothetical protein